jgi:hypothetical protein
VKRITLKLAPGVKTEFTDRDRALAQIAEWAEKALGSPSSYSAQRDAAKPPSSGRPPRR